MDVIEAIRTRYTADTFGAEPPPREAIERLIEAATWAPNHLMTEPWRFHVVAGDARREMGEALAAWLATDEQAQPVDDEDIERARRTAMHSPVTVVVSQPAEPDGGAVRDLEDYAACCAAVQNLLLAAHAEGLVTKWATGRTARSRGMKDHLGLDERDRIVGFIFVGYPDPAAPLPQRARTAPNIDWRGM